MINHVRTLSFNTTATTPPGLFGFYVPTQFRPSRPDPVLARLHAALYGEGADRARRSLRLTQLIRLAHSSPDAARLLEDDPRITYDPNSGALRDALVPRFVSVGDLAAAVAPGPPRTAGALARAWAYEVLTAPLRLRLTSPDGRTVLDVQPDASGWVTFPDGPRVFLEPGVSGSGTLWTSDRPAGGAAESLAMASSLGAGDLDVLFDGFPDDRRVLLDPRADVGSRCLVALLAAARLARALGARDEGDPDRG